MSGQHTTPLEVSVRGTPALGFSSAKIKLSLVDEPLTN